jgi:hypothetical protein
MEGGDEPTTRGDFPGGFGGDKRNAFTAGGRTKDEQELFEYIRKLTTLRRELDPLRNGALFNLYVSEQQYAYARMTMDDIVFVVFNNDDKPAEIEFEIPRAPFPIVGMHERLNAFPDVYVRDHKLRVNLPKRSVAIYTRMNVEDHVNPVRRNRQ